MKKISISILLIATFMLTFSTSLFARTADTYSWDVVQPGYFAWESSNAWWPNNLENTGIWPHISGDVANIFPPNSQTQSYGKFQIGLLENETIADLYGAITNDGFYISESGSPLLVLDDPAKDVSSIVITNLRPVLADGSFNDLSIVFFGTTKIIMSNDLVFAAVCAPNPSNATDYAEMLLYDTVNVFGNGHDIIFQGPGWMTPGWFGDTVEIKNANKFAVNGGLLRLFGGNPIEPPMFFESYYNCSNEYNRATFALAGDSFDLNLTFTNAYMESFYSNWLKRELAGSLLVRDFLLINMYDTGTMIWTNYVTATVSGDGVVYKGYSGEDSGILELAGAIAPGEGNGNGSLHFYSPQGDRTYFGLSTDPLDMNLDINGMRDYRGVDNDIVLAENISSIDFGNINLNINNTGTSNPYRTNTLFYSFDNAFAGHFLSINWANSNRMGEVIVTPQSVSVTGIAPLSNFFDVFADRVVLVKGETQQVLTARSPFTMDVNAVADESWISVQPVISLSNDALVSVPVTVPADQPTTNGYGLSVGTITFSAAADPSVKLEENVYVLEPGYFELNKSKLWIMQNTEGTEYIQVYSPLTVGVQATIEDGSSWITINGDSSVHLTNGGKYVYFDTTAQPVGTTGLISFTNIDTPAVKHDVPVEVVGPGYFETSPAALEFTVGETLKYVSVSAPFKASVTVGSTDLWIAASASLNLDGSGYNVPVVIPAAQADGSHGSVIIVGNCDSVPVTNSIPVDVVPEPAAILAFFALCGLFFRRSN